MATSTIKKDMVRTSGTLSASNWTAGSASFVSGTYETYGESCVINLTLRLTSAVAAGTEYTLGTLTSLPDGVKVNTGSIGIHVFGTITCQATGMIRTMPSKNGASGTSLYIKIITL